jgi:GNAT superfamily N-acetyltransferase
VSSASAPPAFEADLAERGLEMFDQWPGMVAPIEDLPFPKPDGVTCSVVQSEADYDEWADVFRDAFGLPSAAAANMREAHAWPCFHDERRTYLILRDDRQTVATGILHTTPRVAGIYGIAVRRAAQRRGLGRLATLLTVQEGARRGAKLAVLQAKLGFQTICSFKSWRIA